jgi:hypothetical protein
MKRFPQSSAHRQNRRFVSQANVKVERFTATARRLTDLSLAMVIPWRDGWPRWWMNDENEPERVREIIDATQDEVLPWEM